MAESDKDILTPEVLAARAAELAREAVPPEDRSNETGLLLIRVGGEMHAIPVSWVQEVVSRPRVTRAPLAPAAVRGVMNLRGEIIGVVDLGPLLGLPVSQNPRAAVIVRGQGLEAALAVEAVFEVSWLADSAREPVLSTIPAERASLLSGAYLVDSNPLPVVDLSKALRHPDLAALAGEPGAPGGRDV